MKKNRYYVVWKGRNTGIFNSWEECKFQIDKYENATYKGFSTYQDAKIAFEKGIPNFKTLVNKNKLQPYNISLNHNASPSTIKAIAVDAACQGNPGKMEYRGVFIDNGQEIFHSKIFHEATNNIGEFLALVHVLALAKKQGWNYDIYSDSQNAILWVKQGKCKTKLKPNKKNAEVFNLIERAEKWLKDNIIINKIIKWQTDLWGEIPADFGRK